MMSPTVSPVESLTQQAGNAGVPPPSAHVTPNAAAAAAGGPLEESLGQQNPDSSGRRPTQRLRDFLGGQREGSPDQLSPDDDDSSGIRPPPPPVQRRPMDDVGGRGDGDSPDLLSPNSGSSRLGQQGRRHLEATLFGFRWLEVVGFCFLTFNSAMAIYRSWGDAGAISFVASAYLTMLSLFFSIKKFQAAPPNSRWRKELTVCVWFFTMLLLVEFVYQIIGTTAKPTLHLTLLLWAMPAGTGISVFIIFGTDLMHA